MHLEKEVLVVLECEEIEESENVKVLKSLNLNLQQFCKLFKIDEASIESCEDEFEINELLAEIMQIDIAAFAKQKIEKEQFDLFLDVSSSINAGMYYDAEHNYIDLIYFNC